MEFGELIRKRRSLRRYAPKPVAREIVNRCLEAARIAPSACNSQPWHFIIVDDEGLKNKVAAAAFSGIYSFNGFARDASVLVVVVRERQAYFSAVGGFFRGVRYSLIDIGIACEHFILQAEEEGVGSCWLGWFNEKGVKKALGIPRSKKVDVMISMGYAQDAQEKPQQRKALAEMSSFNVYQSKK